MLPREPQNRQGPRGCAEALKYIGRPALPEFSRD
eukprot:COSAG01_NODE_514_length_16043_cov_248.614212_22_plen_33_part_01